MIRETLSKTIKNIESKGMTGHCLICNTKDIYNVCVTCDAIVTARKAYRRYYQKKLFVEKHVKNEFRRKKEIEYYYKDARKFYTSVGINGLTDNEIQTFWEKFNKEFKKLNDDFLYMCKVLQFDTEKGIFNDKIKWFDELKEFYTLNPKDDVPF